MQSFVNHENVVRYRKLIMIAEGDPSRNEPRYQTLLRLLAEEAVLNRQVAQTIGILQATIQHLTADATVRMRPIQASRCHLFPCGYLRLIGS
jgi:hypothetical protein